MNIREYLLVCLVEELSEFQQEICKVIRFTPEHKHPDRDETNLEGACREWSDIIAVLELLDQHNIVIDSDNDYIDNKIARMHKYMKHSKMLGTLECWVPSNE